MCEEIEPVIAGLAVIGILAILWLLCTMVFGGEEHE